MEIYEIPLTKEYVNNNNSYCVTHKYYDLFNWYLIKQKDIKLPKITSPFDLLSADEFIPRSLYLKKTKKIKTNLEDLCRRLLPLHPLADVKSFDYYVISYNNMIDIIASCDTPSSNLKYSKCIDQNIIKSIRTVLTFQ